MSVGRAVEVRRVGNWKIERSCGTRKDRWSVLSGTHEQSDHRREPAFTALTKGGNLGIPSVAVQLHPGAGTRFTGRQGGPAADRRTMIESDIRGRDRN